MPGEAEREHVLLTVLGTASNDVRYRLGGQEVEAKLAPLALYHLLPSSERPDRIVALCTPEAEQASWPLLETTLGGQCRTKLVPVPGGDTSEDIDAYISRAAEAIPDNAEITVDVTHGLRHLSFLTYVAVLYVSTLRDVRVRGAYYGLLRKGETSPFLNLRPLLELPRWLYALMALQDTGSARPMAEILRDGSKKQGSKRMANDLTQMSDAYLSGLPLELGRQGGIVLRDHVKPMRRLISKDHGLPLGDKLVSWIGDFISPIAISSTALPIASGGWKGQMPLTLCELKRQAQYIDDLLERGHVATALGLMNEWTVSWALWARNGSDEKIEWLDYKKERRGAANLLNVIESVGKDKKLQGCLSEQQRPSEQQRLLGRYWGRLRELRNGYSHHGMRPQSLVGDGKIKQNLDHVRRYWKETLRDCPRMSLSLGERSGGRILVSPIGMSPGVLFSALQACRGEGGGEPDLCLVICSHETAGKIEEALGRAGYRAAVETLCLDDPYGDRAEIKRLADAARPHFVGAGDVVVNVTGGTTLMGLVAEAVADAARRLACPVRRFGLIDRRPTAEQERNPWRAGDAFWLDGSRDADADG